MWSSPQKGILEGVGNEVAQGQHWGEVSEQGMARDVEQC